MDAVWTLEGGRGGESRSSRGNEVQSTENECIYNKITITFSCA